MLQSDCRVGDHRGVSLRTAQACGSGLHASSPAGETQDWPALPRVRAGQTPVLHVPQPTASSQPPEGAGIINPVSLRRKGRLREVREAAHGHPAAGRVRMKGGAASALAHRRPGGPSGRSRQPRPCGSGRADAHPSSPPGPALPQLRAPTLARPPIPQAPLARGSACQHAPRLRPTLAPGPHCWQPEPGSHGLSPSGGL